MTLAQSVGWAALALTCGAAVWRGQRPERLGASVTAIGWIVSPLVEFGDSWYQPQFGIFAVDVLALVAFIALTLRYRRYWTICATAYQAITVMTHLAFLLNPTGLYRAYLFGNFSIGFLLLGAILGGVVFESEASPYRLRFPSRLEPTGP
jgi:hypothetical protein